MAINSNHTLFPVDAEVCKRPKKTGRCRAYFRRWYWDSNECKCKRFVFGGCDSNGNNFETEEACQAGCGEHPCTPDESNVCLRPKHSGRCYADFPKWFWNKETCKCERFSYGGCESNGNNFDTKEACMEQCKETPCEE